MNEYENTLRVLAEKPLLMKSRWCLFNVHKWTQYSAPKQRKEGVYVVDYQIRNCDSCGVVDVKILRRI